MTKVRVTFEIDRNKLLDLIHACGGDSTYIGQRIVTVMQGHFSHTVEAGLGCYGVNVLDLEVNGVSKLEKV